MFWLMPYLWAILMDYVGEQIWLHTMEEYAVTQGMSEEVGVPSTLTYAIYEYAILRLVKVSTLWHNPTKNRLYVLTVQRNI